MNTLAKIFLWGGMSLVIQSSSIFAMDDRRPEEHKCPITLDVMRDPVVAADGHSYERAAITRYFQSPQGNRSPSTGAPLASQNLFSNHALKVMIDEWNPSEQNRPDELATRRAGEIAARVKAEFEKNRHLLTPEQGARDQHIVAVLGNTGAGKSTLVNLLAGKRLRITPDGEDYVLEDPTDPTAMTIGQGGGSETLYPKSIDVAGIRFFDLPGFNDSDGSERNLVNAAFIRQILLEAASVRFVFVVGQDQFTADRSASVKQMFYAINHLFVGDEAINLTNNGIFVATKMTCLPEAPMIDFLLKKTDSRDKADLNQQLQSWNTQNKIFRMFHPVRDTHNQQVRDELLAHILGTASVKIRGLNVSALYPSETKNSLERMFAAVMEETFNQQCAAPLTTLSEYDRRIDWYSNAQFWQVFDETLCTEEESMRLLKEFCINPYNKALRIFERDKEIQRQNHIQNLTNDRLARIEDVERRTEERARSIIESLLPQQQQNGAVFFDFAYHKDYYEQVCGTNFIHRLATDAPEQEIVRQYYADFISRHSHQQMMAWMERFSGVANLTRRVEELESRERAAINATAHIDLLDLPIREDLPAIALGNEAIYELFRNGRLLYEGREIAQIANIFNPENLEGRFDLSGCGDAGRYLSINTGYRKGKKPENANKVEIWFVPKFLVERDLATTASHFSAIMGQWTAPIGIFWTRGGWDNLSWYDYLCTQEPKNLSNGNLYEKWAISHSTYQPAFPINANRRDCVVQQKISCSFCELK